MVTDAEPIERKSSTAYISHKRSTTSLPIIYLFYFISGVHVRAANSRNCEEEQVGLGTNSREHSRALTLCYQRYPCFHPLDPKILKHNRTASRKLSDERTEQYSEEQSERKDLNINLAINRGCKIYHGLPSGLNAYLYR
uniref:Uncharacterized protein n=1 Tax=Coccidioides posadasii RMSCC 3488 TaxID=454284 RepID=A0A0J6F3F1_COCPO|nr:hypothetical protein CPAG_00986 [Coccidioides posadasii RMSCC 3488]